MELEERIINFVDVDHTLMENGDVLLGRRFSGSGAEWMLLAGGYANQAAIIIKDQYEWYVADCPVDLGFYLSRGSVRIRTLKDWLAEMQEDDYEVAWLPLSGKLRESKELDNDKLYNWVYEME